MIRDAEKGAASQGAEFLRSFNNKAVSLRIPLSGCLDLTRRCNLKCIHCYAGPAQARITGADRAEPGTGRFLGVIDEIAEAGCLFLLITGGEPLLHPGFPLIYARAKEKGMLVTVFSNGTLVTEEMAELFSDLPPRAVEISLYGATPGTYEAITGVPGSYETCMSGIRRLLGRGVNVKLKTMLMTMNRHELADMERIAGDLGVAFRFDAALFPRFNGDRTPIRLRVPPEEAVELECSDKRRRTGLTEYFRIYGGFPASATLFHCGAGLTCFHIDSEGGLKLCLMDGRSHDLSTGTFLEGWNGFVASLRNEKAPPDLACGTCALRSLCGYCPAFFKLENGAGDLPSEYLCAMGRRRMEIIQDELSKGESP